MSELLDYYHSQAESKISELPWLAAIQKKALKVLASQGFPGRSDEEWKYTKVDDLLQQRFISASLQDNQPQKRPDDAPLSHRIDVVDGVVHLSQALTDALPAGAVILSLADAFEQQASLIEPYLSSRQAYLHGFQSLNAAMMQTGVFIYLPEGCSLKEPVLLSHWQSQAQQGIYQRHVIVAKEGVQASFVEDYRGLDGCSYLTNSMTDIFAQKKARIRHYKIQRESKNAYHVGQLSVNQQAMSHVESHSLSLGGKLVRSDIHIRLLEEGASCLMNGIYAPADGQHIDHHTTVDHLVPNCQSEQDYKGVLSGRARAVFNGKVIVAKDAQHTQAKQQNKNLLLSAQAEIDTKPQLEIFADDVICSHGATVGQLDEEALFYLATRGIARQEASAYLIHAFASENLALLQEPVLVEWMGQLLNQQLG